MLIGGFLFFYAGDDLVPIKRRRLEATAADRQLLPAASLFMTWPPDLQIHEGSWQKYATSNYPECAEAGETHTQPSPLRQGIVVPRTTYCRKKVQKNGPQKLIFERKQKKYQVF